MAVGKVIETLSTPNSQTSFLEFDFTAPKQFSINVTGEYNGRLTFQVRVRETGDIVDDRRFDPGEQIALNGEIVSKQDIRMVFKRGDYRSGSADIALQEEGN